MRSVGEAKARELVLGSALLRPLWNPRLVEARTGRFIAVPDAWFDEVGLAWDVDSYEWHLSPADYDRTLARRVTMTAAAIWVVPHQPKRISTDGPAVLDELARQPRAGGRPAPATGDRHTHLWRNRPGRRTRVNGANGDLAQ